MNLRRQFELIMNFNRIQVNLSDQKRMQFGFNNVITFIRLNILSSYFIPKILQYSKLSLNFKLRGWLKFESVPQDKVTIGNSWGSGTRDERFWY